MDNVRSIMLILNALDRRIVRARADVSDIRQMIKGLENKRPVEDVARRVADPTFGRGGIGRLRNRVEEPGKWLVEAITAFVKGKVEVTTADVMAVIEWPPRYTENEHKRKVAVFRAFQEIGWKKYRAKENAKGKRPEVYREVPKPPVGAMAVPIVQRVPEATRWPSRADERLLYEAPKPAVTEPVAEPPRRPLYAVPVYPHRMWWDNEDTPEALVARAEAAKGPMVPTPDGWVRAAAPVAPVVPAAVGQVAPPVAAPGSSADQATAETTTTSVGIPAPSAPGPPDLWAEMSEKIDPNLL